MKFRCPSCHELFSTPAHLAGAEMTCPMCQTLIEVPRVPQPRRIHREEPQQPAVPTALSPPTEDAPTAPLKLRPRRRPDDELDMTPMVDMTFLLLIFFMVTAAFSLEKSLKVPASDSSQPSTDTTSLESMEDDPQYVIVRIDEYNTFRVSAAAWQHEQEAATKPDLIDKLRAAQQSGPAPLAHMLVMASEEALHERVVAALDAGSAVGMDDVRLMTMPVEQ